MDSEATIPPYCLAQRKRGHLYYYVRCRLDGLARHAPLSNDWLVARGFPAVVDLHERARTIYAILKREALAGAPRPCEAVRGPRFRGAARRPRTITEAAEAFLAETEDQAALRRPNVTARKRRASVLLMGSAERKSFAAFLGPRTIRSLQAADLRAYERLLEDAGYARDSVRSYMADVVRFVRWAVELHLIEVSPVRAGAYTLPAGGELTEEHGGYSDQEMADLRDEMRPFDAVYRAFCVVSQTGVRAGEYLRLRRADVTPTGASIRTARKNHDRIHLVRLVPTSRELMDYLRESRLDPGDYLASGCQEPMTYNALRLAIRRAFQKTGRALSLQRLRRTYGQRLDDAGIDEGTICRWMGNTPRTLRRWYVLRRAQVLPDAAERALSLDLRRKLRQPG